MTEILKGTMGVPQIVPLKCVAMVIWTSLPEKNATMEMTAIQMRVLLDAREQLAESSSEYTDTRRDSTKALSS